MIRGILYEYVFEGCENMSNFEAFFKANKKQIMTYAKANTHYNADGQATISRNDEWFHDDVWEKDVREVNEAGKREYSYTAN